MNMFFKRLTIYFLCFFIAYLPVKKVQAGLPAVAIEIIGGVLISEVMDRVAVPALCGKSPWGANDPVFACEASNTKKGFADKAKKSAKMAAIIAAAGFIVSADGFFQPNDGHCPIGGFTHLNEAACLTKFIEKTKVNWCPDGCEASSTLKSSNASMGLYTVDFTLPNGNKLSADLSYSRSGEPVSIPDDKFNEDFWQTSPQIPPSTWSPVGTPSNPTPTHPDPEWFPDLTPSTAPVTPAPNYPPPLPETHPDHRPPSTPKPEHSPEEYPQTNPNDWPSTWPKPEQLPDNNPGQFPGVWPMPGTTPIFPSSPNPNPNPNPNPDPSLPVPLPVIGPLTRTELETVLNKQYQDAANNLNNPDVNKYQESVTQAMNDFISDKVKADIPEFGFNPFGFVSFGDGACHGFSYALSVGGTERNVTFDTHCPPYDEYVRPTLMWKLYLLTGLYLYMLFTRTVRSI